MRRFLKRLALCSFALCALLFALFLFRAPLLRGAARAWIVDDKLEKADAIVVLGGGLETRPFAVARLYREGYSTRIVFARTKPSPTDELGLTAHQESVTRQILMKEGVPDAAITEIGQDVQNTYGESLAVQEWAKTNHAKTVIIATDVFHTRRAGWVFRKQLRNAGIRVVLQAVPVREYKLADWWQHEQGIVAFQNEVLKYAWYRLKY